MRSEYFTFKFKMYLDFEEIKETIDYNLITCNILLAENLLTIFWESRSLNVS